MRIFDYRHDSAITRLADTRSNRRPRGAPGLATFAKRDIAAAGLPPLVRDVMDKVDAKSCAPTHALPPGVVVDTAGRTGGPQLDAAGGFVDIGKNGKENAVSPARSVWLRAAEPACQEMSELTIPAPALPLPADHTIRQAWLDPNGKQQNEHALESRILRGYTPIDVPGVGTLELIPPPRRDLERYVNWGSQFPTLWGTGGRTATSTPCSARGGHHGQSR